MARQKAKKTKAAKGRSRARRAEVQALRSAGSDSSMDESLIEALPKIDALQDVPSFGDMRVDQSQAAAFQTFVDELLAAGEDAMAGAMRMGVVVRLDRGFPLVATEGLTLRAEHAVAFAKGADMLPAVGDVVAVRCDPGHDMGVIERVLPRRTTFERWRGKNRGERQVLAATSSSSSSPWARRATASSLCATAFQDRSFWSTIAARLLLWFSPRRTAAMKTSSQVRYAI